MRLVNTHPKCPQRVVAVKPVTEWPFICILGPEGVKRCNGPNTPKNECKDKSDLGNAIWKMGENYKECTNDVDIQKHSTKMFDI